MIWANIDVAIVEESVSAAETENQRDIGTATRCQLNIDIKNVFAAGLIVTEWDKYDYQNYRVTVSVLIIEKARYSSVRCYDNVIVISYVSLTKVWIYVIY
jgi:hypothetical protein